MIACAMSTDASIPDPRQAGMSITDRELFHRLAWFTHVRWGFGVFCLLMLLVTWYLLGLRLRIDGEPTTMAPAVRVVLVLFLYNAVFIFLVRIVRARQRITHRLTVGIGLAQILCDLLATTWLIHYTGGVENHFVYILLVPIVIATELLGRALAYVVAGVAAGLFNLLVWAEQQGVIRHVSIESPGGGAVAGSGLYTDPLYILHVTAALTVTVFAMVFIASTIASRLRARERELEGALRHVRTADEAKSFFMRRAGHEMRSPLAAVHSILDAIGQTAANLSDPQRELIERGKLRTAALMELVHDLLTFSRLRSPRDVLRIRPVRLDAIVRNTIALLGKQAEAKGLRLSADVAAAPVRGDEEMLRELVTNLVANAIQYTPSGGRVDVAVRCPDDQAELTVADTGIGISPRARESLFEEFYRAPEAKEAFADGTGMGLAIVRRIVEIHGGAVEADPNRPAGTVFRVTLPTAGPPSGDKTTNTQ